MGNPSIEQAGMIARACAGVAASVICINAELEGREPNQLEAAMESEEFEQIVLNSSANVDTWLGLKNMLIMQLKRSLKQLEC